MTREWRIDDLIDATAGNCSGSWSAFSVSIDSRAITKDALFVALTTGERDGHDFVLDALNNGAVGAMVSHLPNGIPADDPRLLWVENTENALQKIGVHARAHTPAKYIAITGSVGKTGCKEMLNLVLKKLGKTHATQGNLNNHLGVPLTLANMPQDTEYAIVEMGMNHAGEISQLSHWVCPDVAIITTIEKVHMEFFDGIEGIADAKAEIFHGMKGAGTAILNADNAQFEQLKRSALKQDIDRVLSFGTNNDAICQMKNYSFTDEGSQVEAIIAGTAVKYQMGAIGVHWGLMSVAVLGVIDSLHENLAVAAETLAQFYEPSGRGKIAKLPVKGGYLHLIDDSYNASPVSVASACEKMHTLQSAIGGRTIAILGDMLELGEQSKNLHLGLVPTLVNNHIDLVFTAGQFMQQLFFALPEEMRGEYAHTAQDLAPKILHNLQHKDIVLVKGSRGSKMDKVVYAIEEHSQQYVLPLNEIQASEENADVV